MPRKTAWPGLALLDRRLTAVFAGDEVDRLFPRGGARQLIRRHVLQDAGFSSTIPRCICELRRPECVVRVDGDGGEYRGYCNEYGLPLPVSVDQIQRYRFDGEAWADWLRRTNRLDEAGPVAGAGALFIGSGHVAGRDFGLVAIAPGCRDAASVTLPEAARQPGRALVGLALGGEVNGLAVDAWITPDAIADDLGTIDAAILEQALDAVPLVVRPSDAKCLLYSHDSPKGRPVDEAEYERLHRREILKGYDLFVDLLLSRVWRKGRSCGTILDAKGRSKGKKLGDRGVNLLAAYVRRPGVPMRAHETPAYREVVVSPRSAAVLFSEVRRSVHGSAFLISGARASQPGETSYVFEPRDMTWCLLERLPERL